MSDNISELKDAEKRPVKEERNRNWVAGVVLITIGLFFLVSNLTGFTIDNWWALFILIPAISNFSRAWQSYQNDGRFSRAVRGSLTGGLILTLIASAFLFNLDWGLIWPLFLIIGGLAALLGGWFD